MNRRIFMTAMIGLLIPSVANAASLKKFVFKIRTKSNSIVGNILIEANDVFAAIQKLNKRYPGCEILEAREK